MVLGKLPVPGRPTNFYESRAMAYCACSRCRWGCSDIFFSSMISLFSVLSGRRPDIDGNTVSKGRQAPNNQPTSYFLMYYNRLLLYRSSLLLYIKKHPLTAANLHS